MRRAISTPREGIPASTTFQLGIALDDFVRDPAERPRIASASMIGTAADEFCFFWFMRFLCDLAGSL